MFLRTFSTLFVCDTGFMPKVNKSPSADSSDGDTRSCAMCAKVYKSFK